MYADARNLTTSRNEMDYNVIILGTIVCATISILIFYGAALGSFEEVLESLHIISPQSIASCPRG